MGVMIYRILLLLSITVLLFIPLQAYSKIGDEKEILIASWNLKDFWGYPTHDKNNIDPKKIKEFAAILNASNYGLENYDVIFVQELKWNKDRNSFTAFEMLCDDHLARLNYRCDSVPEEGVFNSEGYGIIYKEGIDVKVNFTGNELTTPNWVKQSYKKIDRVSDALARPPMMAKVSVDKGDFEFIVFNNHIKPSDRLSTFNMSEEKKEEFKEEFGSYIIGASQEYIAFTEKELEIIFKKIKQTEFETKNIVVLGDLNADCRYLEYDLSSYDFIDNGWKILTPNNKITNFGSTPCWYDRMIITEEMYRYISEIGEPIGTYPPPDNDKELRYDSDTEEGLSDHKLIWAKFTYGGAVETTFSNGVSRENFLNFDNPPQCNSPDEIYIRGVGFTKNNPVDIYISKFNDNQNTDDYYKTDANIELEDVNDNPLTVLTDNNGNIPTTLLWNAPSAENQNNYYNVIVDVNQDGVFTHSIDVIDSFNEAGFVVMQCSSDVTDTLVPPDVTEITTAIGVGSVPAVLGLAAKYWPSIQGKYKKQRFEKLIFRELSEIGPYPEFPEEGKKWFEHQEKEFLHQKILDNPTENRDFILSLDPDLIYHVNQLWSAKRNKNFDQWVYSIEELTKMDKSGEMSRKKIYEKWKLFEGWEG
jgi:hypothetical protein